MEGADYTSPEKPTGTNNPDLERMSVDNCVVDASVSESDSVLYRGVNEHSSTKGAHTERETGTITFVDIFRDEVSVEGRTVPGSHTGGTPLADNVDRTRDDMMATGREPKILTFSDRVLYEAKKLRERMQRTRSEDPGHVTAGNNDSNASATTQPAGAADDFSPYTTWSSAGNRLPSGYEAGSNDRSRLRAADAYSELIMRSNARVMEWFRNRFNTIDASYSKRAMALGDLERYVIPIRPTQEPIEAINRAAEELELLRQENERLKGLVESTSQLKQRLEEAKANVEELANSLAIERKHNEENIKDKMTLQQRIAKYSEDLKNSREELDVLRVMHQNELEEYEKRKGEMLSNMAQLQKDITHINDNLFSCYKVIEAQKTEHTFLKKENEELKEELKKVRGDLRRLYETNSNLKSQNLSLIEINNRIRTKTLFKTDTADTCSTRGSCSSKASCVSRDEFVFFHVFNDTPSAASEFASTTRSGKDVKLNDHCGEHDVNGPMNAETLVSMSSMTKRAIAGDDGPKALCDAHKNIFETAADLSYGVRSNPLEATVTSKNGDEQGSEPTEDNRNSTVYGKITPSTRDDMSARNTYMVDHSTIYSVDGSTPNYVDMPSGRGLTTEDLSEVPSPFKSKNWLLEKVSRVSNRDSLEFLREKIRLITSQGCANFGVIEDQGSQPGGCLN
ncbi:centrosomal of 85 kDa-like protein, putative [Babesia ovata]|uniref:Centrosomal of 85 kDa-like protein, putative n=1 Tax=Babesia ovata TaxID=189622 RepID=A0A2H6K937_9APIC|nr:centrosomal of 85 kDa-like protein, putative [Babesia ovata]GBE59507.1 centrosomal of 85 kDa-like protein, putative [Babesia ovata]